VVITDGLEARVARLEGKVDQMSDQMTERFASIERWQRVIVSLLFTLTIAVFGSIAGIVSLLIRLW